MRDALIALSANAFANAVGEQFIGAPVVELYDVMNPDEIVERVIRDQAAHLSITVIDRGEPWWNLCTEVLEQYEAQHVGVDL